MAKESIYLPMEAFIKASLIKENCKAKDLTNAKTIRLVEISRIISLMEPTKYFFKMEISTKVR